MEKNNNTFQLKTPLINSGGGSFNPATDLTMQHIVKVISPNPATFMSDTGMTTIVQNLINASLVNTATKADITSLLAKLNDEATTRASADTQIRQDLQLLSNTTTMNFQAVNALIADRTAKITAVTNDVASLTTRVAKNETDISGLKNSITTINGTITTISNRVTNVETLANKNASDINNNKVAININSQDIAYIKTALDNKLEKITFETHLTDFNNEKNKLETLTTKVDNFKSEIDAHSAILDGTKKLSEIELDLTGLQTSVYTLTQKVEGYDSIIDAIEEKTNDLQTFIDDNRTNILYIPELDNKVTANTSNIESIVKAIGNPSSMSNGYIPWNFVKVINASDVNTGWLDNVANQFKIGDALLNENHGILVNRINTNAAGIRTNKAATDKLNSDLDAVKIDVETCLNGVALIPGINNNIITIKEDLEKHGDSLDTLNKKTVHLDMDGVYPENRVSIDQTTVEDWNTDTAGTQYLGSQVILKDIETSKFTIFTILNGFYHRLSQLKILSDGSDLSTILAKITELEKELDDMNDALMAEDARLEELIDNLTDDKIKVSTDRIELNKWGSLPTNNYDQENTSLIIEETDTLKEIIVKTQNRIYQLKDFYNTYVKFGLPANKINSGVNETAINYNIKGELLPSTDNMFMNSTDTIDVIAAKLKLHIDESYKVISEIKIKTDAFTIASDSGVTTVITNGNSTVSNNLIVEGTSTFNKDILVDGKVKANELYISGRKIVLDTAILSNTVRDTLPIYTTSTTTGMQVIDRSSTVITSNSVPITIEPVVLGTHINTSTKNKRSYSVIEKLDYVSLDFYYSFLVDLSSVPNGRLVFFDFIIKDNRTITLTEEVAKKLSSIEDRYTKGFDISVDTDYSIGHYGMAFTNNDTNGRTTGVVKPVIPKLTNVQLGSSTGVYTGEQRFDLTHDMIISEPNTKLIVSEADYKTVNVVVNGGYKTIMFYKSALSTDDSEFFVNMVVRSKIYKKEWV